MITEGTPMDKSLQSLFNLFTQSWRLSKDLRFLKDKKTRKEVCDLIKNVNYCNKTLYRYTYSDFGKIPTTKVGQTCYEPLLSTTEDENFVDTTLYKLAYNDHFADMHNPSPKRHVYCKIVLSSKDMKPCANPLGMKNCFLFSGVNSILTYFINVGDPTRISIAKSINAPCVHLTNLD